MAASRAAAVMQVRGSWPDGAEGECRAEPRSHALLLRLQYNQARGLPPSTWVDDCPIDLLESDAFAYPC